MEDHELEAALRNSLLESDPDLDTRILGTACGILASRMPARGTETVGTGASQADVSGGARNALRLPDRAWKRLGALAAAAVCVAAAGLWFWRPADSWAQVADAIRARPWVKTAYQSADGERHEDWISFAREVSARRDGDSATFRDHRLKVKYGFVAGERTIYRTPDPEGRESLGGWERLFQSILRRREKVDFSMSDTVLVKQQRQIVEANGRKWIRYELVVRCTAEGEAEGDSESARLAILVDPKTHLPRTMTIHNPDEEAPSTEIECSYPEPGPIDIYDLGIPRDAKLVDRVPSDDLERLVAGIRAAADRFDDHVAFTVTRSADAPWHVGTPNVVWWKGGRWRLTDGLIDTAAPPVKDPPPDADEWVWWKRRWKELFHVPREVCDGKTLSFNESFPRGWSDYQKENPHPIAWKRSEWPKPLWKGRPYDANQPRGTAPIMFAYPLQATVVGEPDTEIQVNAAPDRGPTGCVLLTRRSKSRMPNALHDDHFWIDPQRSYLVMRREQIGWDTSTTPRTERFHSTIVVEQSERSPRGIWYPTAIRHACVLDLLDEDGNARTMDFITRHHLVFNVSLSDDLFQPVDRAVEAVE